MTSNPSELTIDSAASESFIVGAVLADGLLIHEINRDVRPDMFGVKWLGAVWKRMCDLSSRDNPVDLLAFVSSAPDIAKQIGSERLVSLQQSYTNEHDLWWHVERLKDAHVRRTLIKHAERLRIHAEDVANTSVDELKSAVEQIANGMAEVTLATGLLDGSEQAVDWVSRLEHRVEHPDSAWGMLTGWSKFDEKMLGLQRGDLVIVGGYTSVGKSAFATETVIRVYGHKHKVAVFSLEMSREQVQNRVAANLSGVKLAKIRTGNMTRKELESVSNAIGTIAEIAICDERGLTADAIAAEMKRWKRTRGLDLVVVDYLQEIKEPSQTNDNTGSAYARVARKLRKAAKQCDCAVIALSQLNRESSKTDAPTIAMLSGSSGIESAADVIILLHRDKENEPETLHVNIAKNRNGETGKIFMEYNLATQRLHEKTV